MKRYFFMEAVIKAIDDAIDNPQADIDWPLILGADYSTGKSQTQLTAKSYEPRQSFLTSKWFWLDEQTGYSNPCDIFGRPLPKFMPYWTGGIYSLEGHASTKDRLRAFRYEAEKLLKAGFTNKPVPGHLTPSLDLPPVLPKQIGIPQKWIGYSCCPRPRILLGESNAQAQGGEQKPRCAYKLPEYLHPSLPPGERVLIKTDVEPQKLKTSKKPLRSRSDCSSAQRHKEAALVAADKLMELLLCLRKPTKNTFKCSNPPFNPATLRAKENKIERLKNPQKWANADLAAERDKEGVEKRRREKFVLHFSELETRLKERERKQEETMKVIREREAREAEKEAQLAAERAVAEEQEEEAKEEA